MKDEYATGRRLSMSLQSDKWAMLDAICEDRACRICASHRMCTKTRVVNDAIEMLYRYELEGEDIVHHQSMPDCD